MAVNYWPIIYVRGFALRGSEKEETVATPYMGFNLGSTKLRQGWSGKIYRHIFESPLVRLMKDYGYQDIYQDGQEYLGPIPARSVAIYRYYESDWDEAGIKGKGIIDSPSMEQMAEGLGDFIINLRDRYCATHPVSKEAFRVYLVAHSMGGLICRCLLQNSSLGETQNQEETGEQQAILRQARAAVDKVFTYGTPHNGIEMAGMNVRGLFSDQIEVFNRKRMREYFELGEDDSANRLTGPLPVERFFSLVGTNSKDYDVAGGWSSRLSGHAGDGLVRMENAYVQGGPRAHVHRSHSGEFGIVNSEAGYQNLVRFLFGDIRVSGTLDPRNIPLPPKIAAMKDQDQAKVRASYHFSIEVAPRGALEYSLSERHVAQQSAVFRTYDEMFKPGTVERLRPPTLFSVYLDSSQRPEGVDENVLVAQITVTSTDYVVNNRLWRDEHIPGTNLFSGQLVLSIEREGENDFRLLYRWNNVDPEWDFSEPTAVREAAAGGLEFDIELKSPNGFLADLSLKVSDWFTDGTTPTDAQGAPDIGPGSVELDLFNDASTPTDGTLAV